MSLNDPFFTKFDGGPDVGRVPTRLIVLGGGELSGAQLRGVEHVYGQFRNACKLSAANFHTEQVKLQDGTIVHMWSLQGRDEVTVTPAPSDEGGQLPHGFVVATNWQTPLFYCRDLNDGIHWVIAGDPVPQIDALVDGIYDNQVFRKAGDAYFNLPHVYDSVLHSIWDYGPDGGLTGGPSGSKTPFRIKNTTTGELTFEPAHYAAQNLILDADGTTLYTVTDEAPILSPSAEGYPDPITYFPGATDAAGNQLAMNAWRYAVLSPSSNIWKFRLWNERIKRVGDLSYEAIERNAQDIITPWSKQTAVVTNVSDSSLGEDPADHFKFKATFVYKSGGYSGGGGGRVYNIGWAGPDQWQDVSGVSLVGSTLTAQRQITEQEGGLATYQKVLAAPQADSIGYIDIESRLNYPANIYWRGGEAKKWYGEAELKALFGIPAYGSLPLNYRIYDAAIFRYDTVYDVDGSPSVTAALGWKSMKLLEGSTTGRMSGKEHTNVLYQSGTYNFIDSSWSYRWITEEIRHIAEFFDPDTMGYPGFDTWMDGANIKDDYWADYMAHGTHPGHTQLTAPNPIIKYEYPFNDRPTNTAEYNLTSRYVIDFDQKGRFYAAIRCEVVCSGAEWSESIATYKGFMAKSADPSYTVKIWFESDWNGVFAQTLLAEESVSRPMFEAITVSMFSPWYWNFPAYVDRDCKVRKPPEPAPDENFMMMFKNLASHQGANTNLCCADVRPDITGADVALTQSTEGIEYSYLDGGSVIPHEKYVTGQLYARTFRLSDIYESLWMLCQLKFDAVEDNFQPIDGPTKPTWFYHPAIKAALDVQRHIEVRDGVIVQWSDNIQGETSGYPPTPADPPAATGREINLYRV